MATGGRNGLRDDGLRCFSSPFSLSPSPPSSSSTYSIPIDQDDDDDLSLRAMEDLCRMSFTDQEDHGQIDSTVDNYHRNRRLGAGGRTIGAEGVARDGDGIMRSLIQTGVTCPSGMTYGMGIGGGVLGYGNGNDRGIEMKYVQQSSRTSPHGLLTSSLSSALNVRDSTHAGRPLAQLAPLAAPPPQALAQTQPLPLPLPPLPCLPPSLPSRRLFYPDTAFARVTSTATGGASSVAAMPLDVSGGGVVGGGRSTLDSHTIDGISGVNDGLPYPFDNLPLLTDEEEAGYLMLSQDLGSLQSGPSFLDNDNHVATAHQMYAQYPVPRTSPGPMQQPGSRMTVGSAVTAPTTQLDGNSVDRLLDSTFPLEDAWRFKEPSKRAVHREPAVADCSAIGSRKVLKANRRLDKNKSTSSKTNPPSGASVAPQASISKYIGDKPSQTKVSQYVIQCLTNFGFCVVDRYMGGEIGTLILNEVRNLELLGLFRDGQLIGQTDQTQMIRGDKIMWVERDTRGLKHIPVLIRQLDVLMESLNGRIGSYQIKSRTKAMVACYPGHGKGYKRHVDNATQDGRCITCIYYLNKDWTAEKDGGLLRMFPVKVSVSVNIEPNFDRLLLFWSDHRNPHEVQPSFRERHAITVWYFDTIERQRFLQQGMTDQHYTESRLSPISMSCGS